MANTKGKIIIGGGLFVILGITSFIIFSHLRKKRVLREIYDKINDTTSEEGQQALLNEGEKLLGSNAFDPNFWKKTTAPRPDSNLLMPTKMAREIATNIYNKTTYLTDDEEGIISELKKLKSKGQVSQVASAFANSPLSYGDLASYVTDTLTGTFDADVYMKQLTTFINNLPN
jgi:hypothetical protein